MLRITHYLIHFTSIPRRNPRQRYAGSEYPVQTVQLNERCRVLPSVRCGLLSSCWTTSFGLATVALPESIYNGVLGEGSISYRTAFTQNSLMYRQTINWVRVCARAQPSRNEGQICELTDNDSGIYRSQDGRFERKRIAVR